MVFVKSEKTLKQQVIPQLIHGLQLGGSRGSRFLGNKWCGIPSLKVCGELQTDVGVCDSWAVWRWCCDVVISAAELNSSRFDIAPCGYWMMMWSKCWNHESNMMAPQKHERNHGAKERQSHNDSPELPNSIQSPGVSLFTFRRQAFRE